MNAKAWVSVILLVLSVFPGRVDAGSITYMREIENSIETDDYQFTLRTDSAGSIAAKSCETCDVKILQVTAETKAFKNNKLVQVKLIKETRPKFIVIFFDPESLKVTRIKW